MTGLLQLVATPIGNLGDISPRAVEALESADVVCCEDTRRTGSLLRHLGIRAAELRRFDDHTEFDAIPELIQRLVGGATVVVVSDAGTPGISDPGQRLVAAAVEADVSVTSLPGPVAAVTALVASGLTTERFVFEGFLARRGNERREQLEAIAAQPRTTVFYESPNRLAATLQDLAECCGPDRRAVVGRELTKLHEELRRGSLDELANWAAEGVKGEIVVVVDGAPPTGDVDDEAIVSALTQELAAGASRRDAVERVQAATGARRKRVYNLALTLDS